MDEDKIDVSAGLVFSLELFALHRLSGTLQAELRRVPGIPKQSIARLEIVNGVIVSCSVIDKQRRCSPMAKEVLIQLNEEKGPFEWSFYSAKSAQPTRAPNQPKPSGTPPPLTFQQRGPSPVADDPDTLIPKVIAPINWHWFHNWTPQQCQALYMVWRVIDGESTVRDIKNALKASYSSDLVDKALRVFISLHVIVLTS